MRLFEKRNEVVASLSSIQDAQERFAWLIARGKRQLPLDPAFKTEVYRVEGCLAKLWFAAEFREGLCFFHTDADSMIVRSIAGLLSDFYSGSQPQEILKLDPSFLAEVGIKQHLTANRRNSLTKVWEKIHGFASECLERNACVAP